MKQQNKSVPYAVNFHGGFEMVMGHFEEKVDYQSHNAAYCHCEVCQQIRASLLRPVPVGVQEQPEPLPNQSTPIVNLVVGDMLARKKEGIRRYGVALQAGNGRDALVDAYHEALDLCMYLRQAIEERRN